MLLWRDLSVILAENDYAVLAERSHDFHRAAKSSERLGGLRYNPKRSQQQSNSWDVSNKGKQQWQMYIKLVNVKLQLYLR